MPKVIKSIPGARRTIQALRDVGYTFATAVADLVDNSIAADASVVNIRIKFEGAHSWVRIHDNGTGMSKATIDEALKFGGERDYQELDLGKFGFGMKTASLSQCRQLTVASRVEGGRLLIRRWDLDYIEKTNDWNLQSLDADECRRECTELLRKGIGTVVFWDKLDRVLDYADPTSKWAENGLSNLCREVEEHVAMVFHRFLSGEAKRRIPLTIFLNGNVVEPWDPYARSESRTQVLDRVTFPIASKGAKRSVVVQPFILPTEARFSSKLAHKRASGPKKWNAQQGFYVYRADRLIRSGGWLNLRTLDEHSKLARVALDFAPEADDVFKVNIAKMQVSVPSEIRDSLKQLVDKVVAQSQQIYRQKDEEKYVAPTPTPTRGKVPVSPPKPPSDGLPPAKVTPPSPGPVPVPAPPPPTSGGATPRGVAPNTSSPVTGDNPEPYQPVPEQRDQNDVIARVLSILMRELDHDKPLLMRIVRALATEVNAGFVSVKEEAESR